MAHVARSRIQSKPRHPLVLGVVAWAVFAFWAHGVRMGVQHFGS
jgi:uncharacterized membrane protein